MELVSHATDIISVSPATADTDKGLRAMSDVQSELWITSSENMSLASKCFDICTINFLVQKKVKALNTVVLIILSPLSDQSYSYPRSIGRVFFLNDVKYLSISQVNFFFAPQSYFCLLSET